MAEKKTTNPAEETPAEGKPAVKKPAAKKTEEGKKPAAKKPAAKKAEKKVEAPVEELPENKTVLDEEVDELEDDVIELVSEDGETRRFYHVATIDYQSDWYVFFQPAEKMKDTDEDEVIVFRLDSDENDNDIFLPVQSEELLHNVYAEYVRLMEEHEEEGGCDTSACATCPNKCR